jgi:hypothetical protein
MYGVKKTKNPTKPFIIPLCDVLTYQNWRLRMQIPKDTRVLELLDKINPVLEGQTVNDAVAVAASMLLSAILSMSGAARRLETPESITAAIRSEIAVDDGTGVDVGTLCAAVRTRPGNLQ